MASFSPPLLPIYICQFPKTVCPTLTIILNNSLLGVNLLTPLLLLFFAFFPFQPSSLPFFYSILSFPLNPFRPRSSDYVLTPSPPPASTTPTLLMRPLPFFSLLLNVHLTTIRKPTGCRLEPWYLIVRNVTHSPHLCVSLPRPPDVCQWPPVG